MAEYCGSPAARPPALVMIRIAFRHLSLPREEIADCPASFLSSWLPTVFESRALANHACQSRRSSSLLYLAPHSGHRYTPGSPRRLYPQSKHISYWWARTLRSKRRSRKRGIAHNTPIDTENKAPAQIMVTRAGVRGLNPVLPISSATRMNTTQANHTPNWPPHIVVYQFKTGHRLLLHNRPVIVGCLYLIVRPLGNRCRWLGASSSVPWLPCPGRPGSGVGSSCR